MLEELFVCSRAIICQFVCLSNAMAVKIVHLKITATCTHTQRLHKQSEVEHKVLTKEKTAAANKNILLIK